MALEFLRVFFLFNTLFFFGLNKSFFSQYKETQYINLQFLLCVQGFTSYLLFYGFISPSDFTGASVNQPALQPLLRYDQAFDQVRCHNEGHTTGLFYFLFFIFPKPISIIPSSPNRPKIIRTRMTPLNSQQAYFPRPLSQNPTPRR